jgi:CDP-diacylglycerol--glycerol-3-phosphate 3-phosphatidyltransferase
MQSIPNWITFGRLALVPIFVALLSFDPTQFQINLAIFVFIVAATTDLLDGYLARRFGAVSDLGKLLDPLVDKILVMSALVVLCGMRSPMYGDPWVPPWMVIVILAREIWVTGLRGLAASQGLIVAASGIGKVKSVLQMIAIVGLLMHDTAFPFSGGALTYQGVGVRLLLLSIIFSVWGAVEYSVEVFGARKRNITAGRAVSEGEKEMLRDSGSVEEDLKEIVRH